MKKLQPNLAYLSIAMLLVASPLMAWMGVNVTWNAADPAEGGRSDTYREAQRALTNEDWEDAEVLFTVAMPMRPCIGRPTCCSSGVGRDSPARPCSSWSETIRRALGSTMLGPSRPRPGRRVVGS